MVHETNKEQTKKDEQTKSCKRNTLMFLATKYLNNCIFDVKIRSIQTLIRAVTISDVSNKTTKPRIQNQLCSVFYVRISASRFR